MQHGTGQRIPGLERPVVEPVRLVPLVSGWSARAQAADHRVLDPLHTTVHPEGQTVGLRFLEDCLYVLPQQEPHLL